MLNKATLIIAAQTAVLATLGASFLALGGWLNIDPEKTKFLAYPLGVVFFGSLVHCLTVRQENK